jgi:3-phytase
MALAIVAQSATIAMIKPMRATDRVPHDPDDPAIWINRADPAKSLVLGTIKVGAPDGGLAVFGIDGRLQQILKGPDRPNNVDVEYGLDLGGTATDIAVLTERNGRRLRVYAIARDGSALRDVSAGRLPILEGVSGDAGAPMGIGLYRRKDGAIFAIVSPKAGPREKYLWQYRLEDEGTGHVKATLVRRFGAFSGSGEIEAVAVDDELGYVYYADEDHGIHKWLADPDAPGADRELALFGTTGYKQDREGIGIYALRDGKGYIVSVDQLAHESVFHVYRREGEPGRPHDHSRVVASFTGGADETDGLDITSAALGPDFPDGMMVAMNSANRNFLMFRWRDIAALVPPAR